jgi:hypothetical protein
VALGVHHRRISSGQKIKGNLGAGFSAMVIGTGGVATGPVAIALGLFGAFRVDAAFALFFLCALFILSQRAAARNVPLHRSAVRRPGCRPHATRRLHLDCAA